MRRARLRLSASASSIISAPTKAGCRRPAFTRSAPARAPGACASARWATSCRSTIRCGWPRKSRSSTRCSAAAWNSAWCRASTRIISSPFGLDYDLRKSPTLEFVDYLRAAYGETAAILVSRRRFTTPTAPQLAVQPVQKPHPPLWMMSRDPQTLEFCASERHQSRLFPGLSARRCCAALPQVSRRLEKGRLAAQAEHRLLHDRLCRRDRREGARRRRWRARRAPMRVFCRRRKPGETFEERVREHAKKFIGRGEPGASEIMANLFDAGLPDEARTGVHRLARNRRRENPQAAARPACSTSSWANSISPTCRKTTSCARSACSAKR